MKVTPVLFGLSLALVSTGIAVAQDSMKPPAILQITREWIKPGKNGAVHDKSEAAFVSAMTRAKVQGHYVALNSMSGKSRALYISRYPSFQAWEDDNKNIEKNVSISAELDRDAMSDGDLLDGLDQVVYGYSEELSFHPRPDLSQARYYQINIFHVRPGHHKQWMEAVKSYKEACEKADIGAHWGMYEIMYGAESGTFIALSHRASLAEIDTSLANGKKMMEAMGGEDGMQKFDELMGEAVDSSRAELFSINPKQSYPEEVWIKGDPDFWKPKAAPAKAPRAATAKPAATSTPKPASR
jgi:hypothetical protein